MGAVAARQRRPGQAETVGVRPFIPLSPMAFSCSRTLQGAVSRRLKPAPTEVVATVAKESWAPFRADPGPLESCHVAHDVCPTLNQVKSQGGPGPFPQAQ